MSDVAEREVMGEGSNGAWRPVEAHPGLKAAVVGMLLLKTRIFFSPSSLLKNLGGGFALGLMVYLWSRGNPNAMISEWLETPFLGYLLPLTCLTMGGGAIRNEIKEYTIEYLWTRALKRSHLLIGTYVASVVATFCFCVFYGTVICLAGFLRGVGISGGDYLSLLLATFGGCLAYVAISLLLGVVTGRFMVLGILYGSLVEVGISQIPMNVRNLAVSHHLKGIYPGSLSSDGGVLWAWALGLGPCLLIAALALAVGSLVFSNKQYSIGAGKD
ncbi:MAG: ABC transporter permease subunit [Verrucomicrobiota bacterium]